MVIAPFAALIAFLYMLNVERNKNTPWGDCFLRAITRTIIWYVIGCVIELAFACIWFGYVYLAQGHL